MNSEQYRTMIPVYTTLSFDKDFSRLMNGEETVRIVGKVHSVFKRVVNFQDDSKQIYSILQRDLDNGPYSIRIDQGGLKSFLELNINVDDLVIIRNGCLEIGSVFKLRFDNDQLWNPEKLKIFSNENTVSIFNENIKVYSKLLSNRANGGVKYYYIKNHTNSNREYKPSLIEKELEKRISNLKWSIDNDYKSLKENIISIVGLGSGLTPSGDDFLVGFITALNTIEDTKTMLTLDKIESILKNNSLSTTDISIMMVKASLEGKARENLISFICALFSNDKSRLIHNIDNVFSIGSSSGADLSVGVVVGLMYSLNILGNGGI